MALPSGYTPLEYIESTGTQYIDTGFKPNQDTRVVLDVEPTTSQDTKTIFGARIAWKHADYTFWYINDTQFQTDYGDNVQIVDVDNLLKRVTIDKNKDVTTVGSYKVTNTANAFQSEFPMYLFAMNQNGAVDSRMITAKVYSCQIYDNGTLVRDYVPVQRVDGTVGLLDQVNNVFYPDAAGGDFIAGPVAVQPEAPETLEVIGTTQNAVVLAWPAVPVDQSYRLYRDGVVVYEGNDLHYTDSGLAAGSSHTYSIHGLGGTSETVGVTAEATTTDGIVLITDRTASDVSAGRRKGYYNALDLIRVGEAMAYLEERFAAVGISVSVSPKLDWQLSDIPTHAQALRYLEDLRLLRGKLTEFRETVSPPDSLTALTWGQANDIETILLDTEKLIQTIILSYRHYSGRTISGVSALP